MSASAESVAAAAQRLRSHGTALRQRPAEEVLDALCRVLDAWCHFEPDLKSGSDSGSTSDSKPDLKRVAKSSSSAAVKRGDLQAELAAEVGFSHACIAEGLQRGLAHWNGKALREVVSRELSGSPQAKSIGGFELTGVILAGAIPMPTLLAILLPLVLRSPVLVKTSSRDPVTARHVAKSIARIDSQLGDCVEVLDFSGSDGACADAFLAADCVVAAGSDATLQRIAERVRPPQRLVSYGHRLSVAVLGPCIRSDSELADLAQRIALDTALWDQQGCLSPAAVYTVGSAEFARDAAAAIAAALERAEERWPRGRIDASDAAAIRNERAEAEMRRAATAESGDGAIELHASAGTEWTVVLEPGSRWRPTPLQRFLRVYPLSGTRGAASLDALEAALRPIAMHLAAVALEGFGDDTPVVSRRLAELGASRVCRAGELQAPPLGWHHDGQPLLLPLARITDIET